MSFSVQRKFKGDDLMTDDKTKQPPGKVEQTIGRTTYIVTSHFQEKGSTAVDKIRSLIGINTKGNNSCQKS